MRMVWQTAATAFEKGMAMNVDPSQALDQLKAGNKRFAEGLILHRFSADEREASRAGQRPFAVVIGCSDSRVPVEAVFDVGVGELFVVRTAGHVLTAAGLASVRFAVEVLGARLVVVLGHEECGAVSAALSGSAPLWLEPIVGKIDVSRVDVAKAPADADNALLAAAVDGHVRATVESMREFVSRFDAAPPEVVGAAYRLESGEVHWLD
jgi:carbonic anhydrase